MTSQAYTNDALHCVFSSSYHSTDYGGKKIKLFLNTTKNNIFAQQPSLSISDPVHAWTFSKTKYF